MTYFFLKTYDFFASHKKTMWCLMIIMFLAMGFIASKLRLQNEITEFLPEYKAGDNKVVTNLKIKDRILVLFTAKDDSVTTETLSIVADEFERELWNCSDSVHIDKIISHIDVSIYGRSVRYVTNHLPLFLCDEDYARIDSLLQPNVCEQLMKDNKDLLSKSSSLVGTIRRDPLHLSDSTIAKFKSFNPFEDYSMYNDRVISNDGKTLFIFIDSKDAGNASQLNDELTTAIETTQNKISKRYNQIECSCYGVPLIATYNARQIKRDLMITLNVALLIIALLIVCSFKQKRALFLLIIPVVFGTLCAGAILYIVQGQISAIAIGTGAVVLGVALSYSVHILSHAEHCTSARQLVEELSYPLTVGSITTIGAFIGLCFTSSPLLHDFGILSATCLIGTTLFCLIFLPHFIKVDEQSTKRSTMRFINRVNSYAYDKNKWLVAILVIVFAISLFKFNEVGFNYDMMQFYYHPQHLETAANHLIARPDEDKSVLVVSYSAIDTEANKKYSAVNDSLKSAVQRGDVQMFMSASDYIPTFDKQKKSIERWNEFWTEDKKSYAIATINSSAEKAGFNPSIFKHFTSLLYTEFEATNLIDECLEQELIFSSLIEKTNEGTSLLSQVMLDDSAKASVYASISKQGAIVDQSYFIGEVAKGINNDYNFILLVSSLLVFVVLVISYKSIELAILAFIPMCVSWFIILGVMAIFHIEFNIVNIILSTFIFGIGDDFSIFVLDGLCNEYRDGKSYLSSHKSAIFFSSIMTIIGMGALLFAKHPAIHSLALVSLLGMIVVVMVSYILQPLLFRLLFDKRDKNIKWPFTIIDFCRSFVFISIIVVSLVIVIITSMIALILPIKKLYKRKIIHRSLHYLMKFPFALKLDCKVVVDKNGVDINKPAVIVPNHLSMLDIIFMMSLFKDLIIVTQDWVWKSPLFGYIVRVAGYVSVSQGEDKIINDARRALETGCSVLIFAEGTRSPDLRVHRFRKGAFYIAQQSGTDILPVALYGTGYLYRKHDWLSAKPSTIVAKFLPHISTNQLSADGRYAEMAQNLRSQIELEYKLLIKKYGPDNIFIASNVLHSYLYKQFSFSDLYIIWKHRALYARINSRLPIDGDIQVKDGNLCDVSFAIAFYSPYRQVYTYVSDADMVDFGNKCGISNLHFILESDYNVNVSDSVIDVREELKSL